jgi:hypothetical protein
MCEYWFHVKCRHSWQILMKLEFSARTQILNFMKIHLVGSELFHAKRRTDGRTDRQADRQTGGPTDGRTDRRADRQTGEPTDGRTERRADRQTDMTKLVAALCNFEKKSA